MGTTDKVFFDKGAKPTKWRGDFFFLFLFFPPQIVLEQMDAHMQRNELQSTPPTLSKKLTQMWILDINVKASTLKFLMENNLQ